MSWCWPEIRTNRLLLSMRSLLVITTWFSRSIVLFSPSNIVRFSLERNPKLNQLVNPIKQVPPNCLRRNFRLLKRRKMRSNTCQKRGSFWGRKETQERSKRMTRKCLAIRAFWSNRSLIWVLMISLRRSSRKSLRKMSMLISMILLMFMSIILIISLVLPEVTWETLKWSKVVKSIKRSSLKNLKLIFKRKKIP